MPRGRRPAESGRRAKVFHERAVTGDGQRYRDVSISLKTMSIPLVSNTTLRDKVGTLSIVSWSKIRPLSEAVLVQLGEVRLPGLANASNHDLR